MRFQAKFVIESKGISCQANEKYISKYGCKVLAIRGKLGILYGYANLSTIGVPTVYVSMFKNYWSSCVYFLFDFRSTLK